ncbi:MAG: RHO alpha subunit C-terminal catalytic domain-containing protein, partial [Candidatus Binataceae bacterium]
GIPQCQELFGVTPRELNARLTPLEIATCGMLIFGRFAAPDAIGTLEQYLGDGYPILQALCNRNTAPYSMSRIVEANWKLCLHVSLDDYHIVAVHPSTFGKTGYLSRNRIGYFRFGRHNAFLNATDDPDALKKMAAACRDGTYMPPTYRILQFFPNFAANHTRIVDRWFMTLHLYIPLAVNRTLWQFWFYPAAFPIEDRGWWRNLRYYMTAIGLPIGVRYFGGRVADEDKDVCEKLQSIAHQVDGSPILGLEEERIAWFEDAYAETMRPAPAVAQPGFA